MSAQILFRLLTCDIGYLSLIRLGSDVPPRKEWIEENVEFTLEDDYQIN